MNVLVNSVDNFQTKRRNLKLCKYSTHEFADESITGLEVPLIKTNHDALPVSPRLKRNILQSHALLVSPNLKSHMQSRKKSACGVFN
jgi:hypothetical protein